MTEMISHLHTLFHQSPITGIPSKPSYLDNQSSAGHQIRCFRSSKQTHNPKISISEGDESTHYATTSRISRAARIEAENALFDYLHCTRNFHFNDAEYISKNAPYYLQKLVSSVNGEANIIRPSLLKFFRYNPINEFEPFLESLGLSPSEVSPLLPRNLMFLSDDDVLLENYHVLCDYGVPRCKMGRMYKESGEIFRSDYGVLAEKLRAIEGLGLSKSMVIELISCSPTILTGELSSEFLIVLEKLKGLGLGLLDDLIEQYLPDKKVCNWKRMLDMIEFLGEAGYTEQQLGSVLKLNPALLFQDSAENLFALVAGLLKFGLETDEISVLFVENPEVLSLTFANNLWQAVCFLYDVGLEAQDITSIVSTHFQAMGSHTLKGPKTVMSRLKVRKADLRQMLKDNPVKLFSFASKSKDRSIGMAVRENISKQQEKTTFLLGLGYAENSEEMTNALKKFRGRGDQLQERFDCLVQAGLASEAVISMIKRAPTVLNQSKDVLAKKIDYLLNYLGYPLESLVAFPAYLCYDLEKINLRFSMYIWLRTNGSAKPMLSLSTILACSDSRFVKYFVKVHPDGPAVWENLKQKSSDAKI